MPAVRCALLAAACAAVLSGLVLAPAPAFAATAAPAAQTAEDAGVRALAERLLAENAAADAPGIAVLVARGDRVLYRGARGLADVELGVALTPEQTFRIGSVTKQFAAAALLKLVEAGKVGLDDPLSKYVKGYPNGEAIKVRHLLDHTSGVKSYTGIDGYMRESIKRELSTQELIAVFKDLPADFAPGQDFRYNNSGYVLLGAVIEAASGQPWHEYLRQSLLQPLKLGHTRYGDVHALIPGMVNGYTRRDNAVAPMDFLDMSQPHAAGALVSTLDDLLRWNRALHGGQVLKAQDYREMTTAHGKARQGAYGYGYGIARLSVRGRDGYAHGGGIFGFSSYLLYLPERAISVAVLSNSDSGAPGGIGLEALARKLAAAAFEDPYPQAQAVAVDAAALRRAEGVYRQALPARSWALRADAGSLSMQRVGGGAPVRLTPVAADEFVYPNGIARLKLVRDAAGAVTAVDYFEDGAGEAQRSERSQEALPPR